jgi:hypothetical protein
LRSGFKVLGSVTCRPSLAADQARSEGRRCRRPVPSVTLEEEQGPGFTQGGDCWSLQKRRAHRRWECRQTLIRHTGTSGSARLAGFPTIGARWADAYRPPRRAWLGPIKVGSYVHVNFRAGPHLGRMGHTPVSAVDVNLGGKPQRTPTVPDIRLQSQGPRLSTDFEVSEEFDKSEGGCPAWQSWYRWTRHQ